MAAQNLDETFRYLGLTKVEAAALLRVNQTSVRRWYEHGTPAAAREARHPDQQRRRDEFQDQDVHRRL